MRERKRGDQHRQQPGVEERERAHGDPEASEDELHRETRCGEEPALAEGVAPPEPQHHGEEGVVDGDEDDGGCHACGGEAEVAVGADELDGQPRRERAQHVVAEVEKADVPGVAVADPLRHDEREHERDEQGGRQHERSRDDERRRGMEAVISADRDAEQRCNGGERQQDRRLPPFVARRDPRAQRRHGGDQRADLDQGRVGGRPGRQSANQPGLPAGRIRNCWDAHLLLHLAKVTTPGRVSRDPD